MRSSCLRMTLRLTVDFTLRLTVDFKKQKHSFDRVSIEGKALDIVSHAKILGMTVSNNLLWSDHINKVIRKSNKRLYFIQDLCDYLES